MATVWVVTQGEYSDYGIVAVFSDKETAYLCARALDRKYEETRVEKFDLNPDAEKYHQGLAPWHVSIWKDGSVRFVELITPPEDDDRDHFICGEHFVFKDDLPATEIGETLTTAMWARDQEHAVKIANERRAMHIANDTWGVNVDAPVLKDRAGNVLGVAKK